MYWGYIHSFHATFILIITIINFSPFFARFDIYSLDKSAQQDEEGIKSAARKGLFLNSTLYNNYYEIWKANLEDFIV